MANLKGCNNHYKLLAIEYLTSLKERILNAQKEFDERMQKSIGVVGEEFAAVRAGRANPAVLDKIIKFALLALD